MKNVTSWKLTHSEYHGSFRSLGHLGRREKWDLQKCNLLLLNVPIREAEKQLLARLSCIALPQDWCSYYSCRKIISISACRWWCRRRGRGKLALRNPSIGQWVFVTVWKPLPPLSYSLPAKKDPMVEMFGGGKMNLYVKQQWTLLDLVPVIMWEMKREQMGCKQFLLKS